MPTLPTLLPALKRSIVRVVIHFHDGKMDVGTAFAFGKKGKFLTCAHPLFCTGDLSTVLRSLGNPADSEAALRSHFRKTVKRVELETQDQKRHPVTGASFDGLTDVAILSTNLDLPVLLGVDDAIDLTAHDVYCCGFPYANDTKLDAFPFAAWKGSVMGKGTFHIGGTRKKPFYFADMFTMGGASGAPVLDTDGRVVAILAGQMTWGADNFVFLEEEHGKPSMKESSLYVPMRYAFLTSIHDALGALRGLKPIPLSKKL